MGSGDGGDLFPGLPPASPAQRPQSQGLDLAGGGGEEGFVVGARVYDVLYKQATCRGIWLRAVATAVVMVLHVRLRRGSWWWLPWVL